MNDEIKQAHEALQHIMGQLAALEGVAFTPKPLSSGPFCSFCGKCREECVLLVQGPSVRICDTCIRACNSILDARSDPPASGA